MHSGGGSRRMILAPGSSMTSGSRRELYKMEAAVSRFPTASRKFSSGISRVKLAGMRNRLRRSFLTPGPGQAGLPARYYRFMKRPMLAVVPQYTEDELAPRFAQWSRSSPTTSSTSAYTVPEDWSDDPAIFIRVLLRDKPDLMKKVESLEDSNLQAAFAIATRISSELRAGLEEFHMPVYFAFRWASEQRRLKDSDWE
jgi:hypothetical protein